MRQMGANILDGMRRYKAIHFNLDGLLGNGITVEQLRKWGSMGIGQANVTNWELFRILGDPALLSKTTFCLGGKAVDIGGL